MEKTKLSTKYGDVFAVPTQKDHIYVEFRASSINADPNYHKLTVRGVEWSGDAHFYLYKDGTWQIGLEENSTWDRRHSLFLSKVYSKSYNDSQPTQAAYNTLKEELTKVITEWVKDQGTQKLLHDAQVEHLESQVGRALEEENDLRKQYDAAKLKRVSLQHELSNTRRGLL